MFVIYSSSELISRLRRDLYLPSRPSRFTDGWRAVDWLILFTAFYGRPIVGPGAYNNVYSRTLVGRCLHFLFFLLMSIKIILLQQCRGRTFRRRGGVIV